MKLRDIRNPDWFWAQNELFDVFLPLIGANGVVVYLAICRMLDDKRWQDGRLSLREIAEMAGVSKDTVRRSRAALVTMGMVAEKVGGTKATSTFALLDLRAAAEVGPEELERRHSLLERPENAQTSEVRQSVAKSVAGLKVATDASVSHSDRLNQKTQHLRGSPENQSVSPRDRLAVAATDDLSHSRETDAPKNSVQSELFLNTTAKQRECDAGAREAVLDLPAVAGMIVLAHPRAQLLHWTPRDIPWEDKVAAIQAAHAEADATGSSPEDAAVSILNKIERIAREIPREEWKFLKKIPDFLRRREYRAEPNNLRPGGSHVRTQPHPQQPARAQRSAATERGVESRTNIAAARERSLRRYAVVPHGADASAVPQSGAAGGDAGHVSGGLGEDGPPLRAA